MNVDAPTGVGIEDIVSTGLELVTAAEPINGPKVFVLEPMMRALPKPDPWMPVRNAWVDAGSEILAGYILVDVGEGIEEPSEDGAAVDVVAWTALSDTPAAVGVNCVMSGDKRDAWELAGSISSCKSLGADGSSRFVSTGV